MKGTSTLRGTGRRLEPEELPGAPACEAIVAPGNPAEFGRLLEICSEEGRRVLVWGAGTHQGYGHRVEPDVVVSLTDMARLIDWQPGDLTVVAEAGLTVAQLEAKLETRGQTAVLPEHPGSATVGGVVASGVSGFRRERYGPTRDRVLEVVLVTGDGRLIRGGGRVVKNVTGYDLPRLVVGSFGALGVITQVCLKLWPAPVASATIRVDDAEKAALAFRPLSVVDARHGCMVFVWGTEAEVDAQARAIGGERTAGLNWPRDPIGSYRWSLRVPPSQMAATIDRLPASWDYLALVGVGEIRAASPTAEGAIELRDWCERQGGALVVVAAPDQFYPTFDPWGTPPRSLSLQQRLVARFDPARILNPGRLPGGL